MPSLNRLTDINNLYTKSSEPVLFVHLEFKNDALKRPRVQKTNFWENLLVLVKEILVLGALW